jgi:uncharacterized membrane protein
MVRSKKVKCCICNLHLKDMNLFPLILLKSEAYALIKQDHPHIRHQDVICFKDMDLYKLASIKKMLPTIKGSEERVIDSFKPQEILSKNINHTYHAKRTLGEKLADHVATFGGSWSFIISFTLFMVVWIVINSYKILGNPLDPFPYILLNLILSCLAALQAPIIMMSQNRQEAKDRLRANHDYEVNLKAELEIRMLSSKIDHYAHTYWKELQELQKQQQELTESIRKYKDL